ncbi:MAG: HPr-rel-A system PqqD family peptide chaperone [Pseudomonadota bacterium]
MGTNVDETDTVWCSPPKDAIRWIAYDDGFVAYHRPSGATHFLNGASKVLIEEILSEPKGASAVADEFAEFVTVDDAQAYVEEIRAMLLRFDELGLVRRL